LLTSLIFVRFQVLTATSMKFRFVFWDVLPCKIIVDALMMEAARTSETSVYNYFTRQYIPEDKCEHHLSFERHVLEAAAGHRGMDRKVFSWVGCWDAARSSMRCTISNLSDHADGATLSLRTSATNGPDIWVGLCRATVDWCGQGKILFRPLERSLVILTADSFSRKSGGSRQRK
jgi:hypothetical protein